MSVGTQVAAETKGEQTNESFVMETTKIHFHQFFVSAKEL